jgi:hypothetical protein
MKLIRAIYPALLRYDEAHNKLPESLLTLVSENLLTPGAIHIKLPDGSVQVPIYFPGHTKASPPNTVLVAYDLPDTQKRIVLKINGAVTIERKPSSPPSRWRGSASSAATSPRFSRRDSTSSNQANPHSFTRDQPTSAT